MHASYLEEKYFKIKVTETITCHNSHTQSIFLCQAVSSGNPYYKSIPSIMAVLVIESIFSPILSMSPL